jgi:hypothetical protein
MLMKENTQGDYISPEIDVIVIEIEQGFAVSGGSTEGFDNQDGGW